MGKILIVAEKPAAGQDIAKVVGATTKQNGYMEGDKYIVTWAVGHLIGLKQPQEHDEKYKKWNLGNLPIFFDLSDSLKVLPDTSHQYKVIKELIHRTYIDMLINAGDAGREGYLIQEWIYRMAGCRLPKKVLWASSLTTAGIQNAMDHLKDNNLPEFQGILREAEARAEEIISLDLITVHYLPLQGHINRRCLMDAARRRFCSLSIAVIKQSGSSSQNRTGMWKSLIPKDLKGCS